MQRHAGRLWAGALLCLFLIATPPAGAAPRAAAIVTALPRDVSYQRSGFGPFLPLRLHAPLYPGDVVHSGPAGSAELLFLSDGSSVKIDSNSTLRITMGMPARHQESLFEAILGVIWAHLRPGTNVESPGRTNTVTQGTEILLSVTADGTTTLTVIEGDVSFFNPQGARELTTGQQSRALPGQAPTLPVAVDVSGLIAWTADVAALPLEFELPAPPPGPAGPPNTVASWVAQGQARRELGDLAGARDAFGQALRLNDASVEARVGLALTYLSQGQPAQARAALEPVGTQPLALAALGLTDLHEGRGADAERDLRAARTLDPHLSTASALLALASLSRDDLPDALTASQQAVAARPDSAQAQGTRAMVLFFAGQPEAAEQASRRAVRLNPLSPFALLTEGRALLARQQTDAARTAYEKAASIAPYLWLVHQELGAVYLRLDMPRKADEEYRATLALNPGSADAHTGLGLSLQNRGRYAEAEREHRQALTLDPNNATAHYNLATLLIDRGRLDEARQELESGVRAAPERGILYARLAEISLYRQDLFAAQDFARRAVSLLPDSALAHYELGRVYLEQERTIQAEQEFRQATTLDRQFAAARYALGLTQEKTEAGLVNSFSSLLDSALVGSPGSAGQIYNLQTPGAEQRIQAALLDPTVVRSASRSYGNTQLNVTLGQQDTRDIAGSYLSETSDRRGVRGISGEEQYTDGVRTNADYKLDTANFVLGQKSAIGPAGYLVLGDYEETDSGSDTGLTPDPSFYLQTQRYHTQLPRLLAGVNLQMAGDSQLLALVQISEAKYTRSILGQPNDYDHYDTRSLDGELRWDAHPSASNLFIAGFSYGDRSRRDNASVPDPDPTVAPALSVLTTSVQPYQFYTRDEFQASSHLLLTGQMQVLSLSPIIVDPIVKTVVWPILRCDALLFL